MLIVDGHVVDPATGLHEIADVLIEQDCIKKIYVRSRGWCDDSLCDAKHKTGCR